MIQQQYNTTSAIDSDGDVALRSDSGSTQGSEAVRLTLRKAEKLRHKSLVENLFKEGFSVYEFPLRMQVRALSEDELESSFRNGAPDGIAPLQMLVTVPKKKRRHAVDRVLMRRRIREAYRLGRGPLRTFLDANPPVRTLSMAFIYMCDKNLPYSTIERKMQLLLKKAVDRLNAR